jgi:hypothetical protein
MSWLLEAIEAAAEKRVYDRLSTEAYLGWDIGLSSKHGRLRWWLYASGPPRGEDDLRCWQEDDLLSALTDSMRNYDETEEDRRVTRDRYAAALRAFADRVAALEIPS